MKQKHILLTLGALMLLGMTSCKEKNLFNKEIYDQMVDFKFMVDNMDRSHDWQLIKNGSVMVKAPDNVSRLQVLTADPYSSPKAEIAAEVGCVDGQATLNYSIPTITDMLYLAALASDGTHLGVVPFQYDTQEIDLRGVALQNSGQLRTISPQTFSYLYEATFPEPGDFDYNDLVLRISKHYTSDPTLVLLTVKVDAVGIQKQVAAAIQLAGFRYEDVTSVSILEGDIMDANDYLAMLDRAKEQLPENIETHDRFELPELDIIQEGKITIFKKPSIKKPDAKKNKITAKWKKNTT